MSVSRSSTYFIELKKDGGGKVEQRHLGNDEFHKALTPFNLSMRDKRLLQRREHNVKKRVKSPVLHSVSSGKCFVMDMEDVKLVCSSSKCLIFNPGQSGTRRLEEILKEKLEQNCDCFDNVVIGAALEVVLEKFRRNLRIQSPALESLLKDIQVHPETNALKRLLAVKKSLSEFERRIELFLKVVQRARQENENENLDSKIKQKREEVYECCLAELDEIETDAKIQMEDIEDTNQFIDKHLDHVRNEIMRMSLKIEVGAFIMGFGAVVGGIFGMNLANGIETDKYAFHIVWGAIVLLSILMFIFFMKKIADLKSDTSDAREYNILQNFFTYIDELENYVANKPKISKQDFKEAVEKITRLTVEKEEVTYLFRMFDHDNDGMLDTGEELKIKVSSGKEETNL